MKCYNNHSQQLKKNMENVCVVCVSKYRMKVQQPRIKQDCQTHTTSQRLSFFWLTKERIIPLGNLSMHIVKTKRFLLVLFEFSELINHYLEYTDQKNTVYGYHHHHYLCTEMLNMSIELVDIKKRERERFVWSPS